MPESVRRVLTVGERTGELGSVLEELGAFHQAELEHAIGRVSRFVEPALLLIVGGMVGTVYFAFFQTVIQLSSG